MSEKNKIPKISKKHGSKRLVIVLAACVALMCLLLFLNSLDFNVDMSGWFGGRQEEVTVKPKMHHPDYEENIFENEEYMGKNRAIMYTDGGVTSMISSAINEYGAVGDFFLSYFDTVINGDAASYNRFFTDEYLDDEDNVIRSRFTMQMLYDMEVELLSDTLFESGGAAGTTRRTFRVSYKIMLNNGTFRNDMPSDTMVPVIIEVLDIGGVMKINSIIKNKLIME